MDIRERIAFLDDNMLVLVQEPEARGLIIVQSKLPDRVHTGTVMYTGPGKRTPDGSGHRQMDVQVGDDVVFAGGITFGIDGVVYKLITEEHVLMHREAKCDDPS